MTIQNVDLKVVGVTFKNEDGSSRKDAILVLAGMEDKTGVTFELVREPDNKYDINAVKVMVNGISSEPVQIGYVGKEYASIIAPLMDMGEQFKAELKDCGEFKNRPYCEITMNQVVFE